MTKRKGAPAKRASEPKPLDLLPREEVLRRTEDLLRTMLNTPPKPFIRKAQAKPKKRAK
jgi:hypothetical protein